VSRRAELKKEWLGKVRRALEWRKSRSFRGREKLVPNLEEPLLAGLQYSYRKDLEKRGEKKRKDDPGGLV